MVDKDKYERLEAESKRQMEELQQQLEDLKMENSDLHNQVSGEILVRYSLTELKCLQVKCSPAFVELLQSKRVNCIFLQVVEAPAVDVKSAPSETQMSKLETLLEQLNAENKDLTSKV